MSSRGLALNQVSSRAELERFLDEAQFAQAGSLERLRRLAADARGAKRLDELAASRRRLESARTAAQAVAVLADSAAQAGDDVRARVAGVLELYERARAAREFADGVILLRESVQGIHGAMEIRDWDRAAELAGRARAVPPALTDSSFAARMVPSRELPDLPRPTLDAACADMARLFAREFDAAAAARQMDQVTRYFKLFPLIGCAPLGLAKYATFICQIIAGLSRNLLHSAHAVENPVFYSAAFAKLFENVATIVGQHAALVTKYYGATAMPDVVVPRIQEEVDKQAGLIVDTFWDERRIEVLIAQCRAYSFPYLMHSFVSNHPLQADAEPAVDLRDASSRLSELAVMLNRWALYRAFLSQRWPASAGVAATLDASTVAAKVADILGPTFAVLALFIFRRSVEKAVELDELPGPAAIAAHPLYSVETPLVSSLVDDVMYVFSNVLSQAGDTGHIPTMRAAFAGLRRVLESDYIGTLQRKLRSAAPTDAPVDPTSDAFMIYLDDLEVTSDYVDQTVRRVAPAVLPEVTDSLDKFALSFRVRTKELLGDGCQTLAALRVGPQLRAALNAAFTPRIYLVGADAPRRAGAQFELSWHTISRPLRRLLHPVVYNMMLNAVVRTVAHTLESFIWTLNGRINELGCIALDRDISQVIALVSETQYALRKGFVRVAQMVTVLVESSGADGERDFSELTSAEVVSLKSFVVQ